MNYAVVMAGGAGTRLWPAARRESPKQLQRLIFEQPLIAETVRRLEQVYDADRILVVTAERYAAAIRDILSELPAENIVSEPVGRNTAAAIALAAFRIVRDDPNSIFAVFPADHVILKPQALFDALNFGNRLATTHRVVDIGVPPSHPETGYGYIELGDELEQAGSFTAYGVRRFVEKPDRAKAEEYLQSGRYIWNSGMFIWRTGEFLEALQQHLPDTYHRLQSAVRSGDREELAEAYAGLQDISVDYAIMERVDDVVAIPVDFGWRDIGDWAALYDMMDHDEDGNASEGKLVALDTHDSLVFAPGKLVATIGIRDLVVVDTDDVLLVMPRSRAQEVKALLDQLKSANQAEYL
ncbi:MAG TPA: sugar phosphate nucleotidyltransferase [Chloroflexota bacterium]|nr:sugar phosphate nucleotidyltransferase [Chloroflexota bacterium]